jgi:hypothetical protein
MKRWGDEKHKAWLLAGALSCMGVAQADERDVWMFAQWAGDHENRRLPGNAGRPSIWGSAYPSVAAVGLGLEAVPSLAFRRATRRQLAGCAHDPALIKTLDDQGILRQFEVVSAYREPRLNACAGGAPSSAHMRAFAVDICCRPGPTPTRCAVSGSSTARPGTWAWGAILQAAFTWIPPVIAPGAAMAVRGRRSATSPNEPGPAFVHYPLGEALAFAVVVQGLG